MKAARSEASQAKKTLSQLLRTPKTRAGLIAAVKSRSISRNFVFGWLIDQCRTGKVIKLKSGVSVMYQMSGYVTVERPAEGVFPPWLEPRTLPVSGNRRVFIDGVQVDPDEPQKQQEQEES